MTALLLQISTSFSASTILHNEFGKKPIKFHSITTKSFDSFHSRRFILRPYGKIRGFIGERRGKDGILVKKEGLNGKKRLVVVRFNQGFGGFNGGGGGGGGRDNSGSVRLLGNLALAAGLTYLSVTGQLGWVLDAIVSIWLLVVLIPIVGLGVFLWWAGRDIVQGTCPNCGNDFQIFKSLLNDELQLCPYCSQPFSVVGDKFVSDPVKFYNESTTFGQAFDDFFPQSKKGKQSAAVVDVEAEVKDVE